MKTEDEAWKNLCEAIDNYDQSLGGVMRMPVEEEVMAAEKALQEAAAAYPGAMAADPSNVAQMLELYQKCVNVIDDYFEYSHESETDKQRVMHAIGVLRERLGKLTTKSDGEESSKEENEKEDSC